MNWLIQILNFLPSITVIAIFVLGVIFYLHPAKKILWILIWTTIVFFYFGIALAKSIVQYLVWNQGGLSQTLLNLPLEKIESSWFAQLPIFTKFSHGYFLFYILNHFWINALLSVVVAFGVYKLFQFLRQRSGERFFDKREAELGFLMSLIVGWPQLLIFLPLVFLIALIFSIVRKVYRQEVYTSLGWPFIIAAATSILFHSKIASLLIFHA